MLNLNEYFTEKTLKHNSVNKFFKQLNKMFEKNMFDTYEDVNVQTLQDYFNRTEKNEPEHYKNFEIKNDILYFDGQEILRLIIKIDKAQFTKKINDSKLFKQIAYLQRYFYMNSIKTY